MLGQPILQNINGLIVWEGLFTFSSGPAEFLIYLFSLVSDEEWHTDERKTGWGDEMIKERSWENDEASESVRQPGRFKQGVYAESSGSTRDQSRVEM